MATRFWDLPLSQCPGYPMSKAKKQHISARSTQRSRSHTRHEDSKHKRRRQIKHLEDFRHQAKIGIGTPQGSARGRCERRGCAALRHGLIADPCGLGAAGQISTASPYSSGPHDEVNREEDSRLLGDHMSQLACDMESPSTSWE